VGVEVLLYPPDTSDKPSVEARRHLAIARGAGLNVTIKRGVLDPTVPSSVSEFCTLKVKGRSDRLHIFLLGLRPVDASKVTSWPVGVSFMLCAGMACAVDVRKPISGTVPDAASIAGVTDVRAGTLYHAANMVVQQWALYAAVDPTASADTDWQATLVIEADYLGGGGKVEVYKGGVFVP